MEYSRRRKRLLVFMLLFLAITIGFALLNTSLFINGTSRIHGNTWNIHWDSTSVKVSNGSVQASKPLVSTTNGTDDTVTFSAEFELPGDYFEFTVDAINEGTIDGAITLISDKVYLADGVTETTLPSYMKYSVKYDDNDGTPTTGDILTHQTSRKYKIRVEFDENAKALPNGVETLVYKYQINYQQSEGGEEPPEPTVTPVCIRAHNLHTETCSDGSCKNAGYASGSTITYGKVSNGNYDYGNAYDCDMDADENHTYESRFYYVGSSGENAALIFYTSFDENGIVAGAKDDKIYQYGPALTVLANQATALWTNEHLVKFDGVPARLITIPEVENSCGITVGNATTGETDGCQFLLEVTRFSSTNTGRTGIWLQKHNDGTSDIYKRIHTQSRIVGDVTSTIGGSKPSENSVRPVIEVPFEYIDNTVKPEEKYTITFDSQGGSNVNEMVGIIGVPIGTLPTPTKDELVFKGWYTDNTTYTTKVDENSTFNENITLYAKWGEVEGVAAIGNTGYPTLAAALTAATTPGVTIRLLDDISGTSSYTISASQNITLNLNGHTLSVTATNNVNVINNNGTLVIKNGNITSTASAGAINNNKDAVMTIDGVNITVSGNRQAVYNKGGNLTVKGGSILRSTNTSTGSSGRGTLQNLNDTTVGTTKVLDATIISVAQPAIVVEAGVVTLGEEDGVSINTPVLEGGTYGIATAANSTTGTFKYYDGIIKGKTHSIDNDQRMIDKEDDSSLHTAREGDYEVTTLTMLVNKYKITFDPNDGEVTPTMKLIPANDPVGELPIPTKGVYTFEGWYTGLTDGVRIDENEVPTGHTTYYAHWVYNASDEIVQFNITNEPMSNYYTSISTWKNDQSTFQTEMDTNFNSYNCSSCTGPNYQECPTPTAGTKLCDQAEGYSTGVNENVTVYEYNENTEETTLATYVTVKNGVIYNMIPGTTYYWVSPSDNNIHGYVKANGNRRIITTSVRNVRDLGGLEVDTNNDGVVDGTLKYGIIFRGAKLSSSSTDADNLEKLGITTEIDLRGSSDGANDAKLDIYENKEITNYLIYPDTYPTNYATFRQALVETMVDVIANKKIYFHCKIGTDRTGTMAYFLEGLLGVSEEDRVQDYELSYFYGLLNRHRFHDQLSGSSINPRFTTMYNTYNTNQKIYEWFTYGLTGTDKDEADDLIDDFRQAMIDKKTS